MTHCMPTWRHRWLWFVVSMMKNNKCQESGWHHGMTSHELCTLRGCQYKRQADRYAVVVCTLRYLDVAICVRQAGRQACGGCVYATVPGCGWMRQAGRQQDSPRLRICLWSMTNPWMVNVVETARWWCQQPHQSMNTVAVSPRITRVCGIISVCGITKVCGITSVCHPLWYDGITHSQILRVYHYTNTHTVIVFLSTHSCWLKNPGRSTWLAYCKAPVLCFMYVECTD